MAEALVLLAGLTVAGAVVLRPLWRERRAAVLADAERDAAEMRHRVALEALRDLDVDRRAGLIDEAAHASLLAEAEARAAETRAALDRARSRSLVPTPASDLRMAAVAAAAVIGLVLVLGVLVPATGLANATVVNRALADAQAAERQREARIGELRSALAADPGDAATLSELADLHLAGTSEDDLARAAAALQLLIALEPDRADAYERIITAYLRAGDYANARAALDAYEQRPSADPVETAFFDGLIVLRGEDDPARARRAFDRFLELAPDDPRAEMVRSLRDEAADSIP